MRACQIKKYRGNNEIRKSPFGNCHGNNGFNQDSTMDLKQIDENLMRSRIFTSSQSISQKILSHCLLTD